MSISGSHTVPRHTEAEAKARHTLGKLGIKPRPIKGLCLLLFLVAGIGGLLMVAPYHVIACSIECQSTSGAITLSTTVGSPGAEVTVVGTCFTPHTIVESIKFSVLEVKPEGDAFTDKEGRFETVVVVPRLDVVLQDVLVEMGGTFLSTKFKVTEFGSPREPSYHPTRMQGELGGNFGVIFHYNQAVYQRWFF